MSHPKGNLTKLSQSIFIDPHIVYKYHWLPWNWGYLSSNPAVPSWLVLALIWKPWDWISLADSPSSHILRKRVRDRFLYHIHLISPFENLGDVPSVCNARMRYLERKYKTRIAAEIYNRRILPNRRKRWKSIVRKVMNEKRYYVNVARNITNFIIT